MKLAAIDIGTNSIHIVVVEVDHHGFEVIDREKTMVKLGQGVFNSGRLSERAFSEGLQVVRRYAKLAESRNVDDIVAAATSATREAQNGGDFLRAIRDQTGIDPRVISGTEEARLIFLAVNHALELGTEKAMVFDVGGGSVEVVIGDRRGVYLCESLRLGVQRLLDRQGHSKPLAPRKLYELMGYIRGAAADTIGRARNLGYKRVIGTSGTIRTLGEAAHLATGAAAWNTLNAQLAKRKEMKDLSKHLVQIDVQERAKIPGISEQRADAIHLGAVLLTQLLELADSEEITLCDASLREGLIIDYMRRHDPGSMTHRLLADPRRRSVMELAQRYEREDPHERHVAELALKIFDGTVELHGLDRPERELLEFAALLHGVGQHINYVARHKHARYIIRHFPLRGFTDEEIELLSLVVRFHRRAQPTVDHPELKELAGPQVRIVRILAAILRIAVALDRGDAQVVKSVRCSHSNGKLELFVAGDRDLELELWAARRKLKPLEKAVGKRVLLRAED